ncbi:MAG: hypothetical protein R3C14_18455 [Caldilineaceae bacterium]
MLNLMRKDRQLFVTQLLAHIQLPLYRNGYALLLSGILSSGLGMLYWLLAARLYSAAIVGLNSAVISAMMLLAGLAQLSLNGALVRFLPRAGQKTRPLVGYAYLVSIGLTVLMGLLFGLGYQRWAPSLNDFFDTPAIFPFFIASIAVWCIFALQDSVLTGLRQAPWVPLENMVVALLRILLLLLFAHLSPQIGIFIAWMAPTLLSLAPINFLIFRRFIPQHISANHTPAFALAQLVKYVTGNYFGTIFFLAYTTLLPIIVTQRVGAKANAYFYIPWMIATGLQLIAANMTTSLTVEAVHDERQIGIYCYRILRQSMRMLILPVLLIVLIAPWILRIFGATYASEGTLLLRLLALATLPNVLIMLYLSFVRVQNQIKGVILTQGALCVLLLGLSYTLLPHYGIIGVGIAALVSQSVTAILVMVTPLRPLLYQGRSDYALITQRH